MRVGVLTSSRADYGIYLPLLKELNSDPFFDIEVIAFGTHLLEIFGRTVNFIYKDGFSVTEVPGTMIQGDLPINIAHSMAATLSAFSELYNRNQFKLLFALGDRYEMFSAVAASAPFNIPVAHIHGGETTLGAIDNCFRHSITCFSKFHFTTHEIYKGRVIEITGGSNKVYNVGALSIDNLKQTKFLEVSEFKEAYGIDLTKPTILFTFHPETVNYERNKNYIEEILDALKGLVQYQIIATMPNADTMGMLIRNEIIRAKAQIPDMITVESFGSLGYLSAMKHCSLMLGNSSSGFVEASWFPKPVINIGDRQKGRIITSNMISCPVKKGAIIESVHYFESNKVMSAEKIYGDGSAAHKIITHIKEFYKYDD